MTSEVMKTYGGAYQGMKVDAFGAKETLSARSKGSTDASLTITKWLESQAQLQKDRDTRQHGSSAIDFGGPATKNATRNAANDNRRSLPAARFWTYEDGGSTMEVEAHFLGVVDGIVYLSGTTHNGMIDEEELIAKGMECFSGEDLHYIQLQTGKKSLTPSKAVERHQQPYLYRLGSIPKQRYWAYQDGPTWSTMNAQFLQYRNGYVYLQRSPTPERKKPVMVMHILLFSKSDIEYVKQSTSATVLERIWPGMGPRVWHMKKNGVVKRLEAELLQYQDDCREIKGMGKVCLRKFAGGMGVIERSMYDLSEEDRSYVARVLRERKMEDHGHLEDSDADDEDCDDDAEEDSGSDDGDDDHGSEEAPDSGIDWEVNLIEVAVEEGSQKEKEDNQAEGANDDDGPGAQLINEAAKSMQANVEDLKNQDTSTQDNGQGEESQTQGTLIMEQLHRDITQPTESTNDTTREQETRTDGALIMAQLQRDIAQATGEWSGEWSDITYVIEDDSDWDQMEDLKDLDGEEWEGFSDEVDVMNVDA